MTLFFLTDDNLGVAKSILRETYSHVRSAHLTEALAFGLGFGTNAALRAQLAAEAARPPVIADGDARRFAERLAGLGYTAVEIEPFEQTLASRKLPASPIARFKRGDTAANNRHHDDCLRADRPMMMIIMGRLYAELQWDCITTSSIQYGHLDGEEGDALGRTMFARFQALTKGAPGKPYFTGKASTGWVERLLPATAERLAAEYFKLLYLPSREPPRRAAA